MADPEITGKYGGDVAVATKEQSAEFAQLVEPAEDEDGEKVIDTVFITDAEEVLTAADLALEAVRQSMRCFEDDQIHHEKDNSKVDVVKFSTTSLEELVMNMPAFPGGLQVVEPPYPPEILAKFVEADETHYRCVRAKATDAVGRPWTIRPADPNGGSLDPGEMDDALKKQIMQDTITVRRFIEDANPVIEFEGVSERAAMDYETIGWAGIEVVRSREGKVVQLNHIPACRLRVLRGWEGFVEIVGPQKFIYYLPFGQKVLSKIRKNPVTEKHAPYNPRDDGPLEADKIEQNLIDRETGKRTNDFSKAASELIWIPRHHPNTVYYGLPDIVPALGKLLANVHIRDYMLQFFEYNCVPQYAVIVEGARLKPEVKQQILKFFSQDVKGKAHKTLVIPIPGVAGEVKVRFERLAAGNRESSFQETQKNNAQGIMVAHGVSPAIIGIADAASLGSGKGLSQAEIYKDRIVTPSQTRWQRIWKKVFRLGLGVMTVILEYTQLDIRDMENEMTVNTGYFKIGAMTIDEVRQRARIGEPIAGGGRAFITEPTVIFLDELEQVKEDEKRFQEEVAKLQAKIQAGSDKQKVVTKDKDE